MISLHRFMKTGRGELLEKDYKTPAFMGRLGQRLAMERILMQASVNRTVSTRVCNTIQYLISLQLDICSNAREGSVFLTNLSRFHSLLFVRLLDFYKVNFQFVWHTEYNAWTRCP